MALVTLVNASPIPQFLTIGLAPTALVRTLPVVLVWAILVLAHGVAVAASGAVVGSE